MCVFLYSLVMSSVYAMIGIASASSVMVLMKTHYTYSEHNTRVYTSTKQGYSTGFSVLKDVKNRTGPLSTNKQLKRICHLGGFLVALFLVSKYSGLQYTVVSFGDSRKQFF